MLAMSKSNYSSIVVKNLGVANWREPLVEIKKNQWTALTGPSGAGKTTFLFEGLLSLSKKEFSLLDNPRSNPGDNYSSEVSGLTPVLASSAHIPQLRESLSVGKMLGLNEDLRSIWSNNQILCCDSCSHVWSPDKVEDIVSNIAKKFGPDSKVLVLGLCGDTESSVDLLNFGLTRYVFKDGFLRIEDCDSVLPKGSTVVVDRFRLSRGESRLKEAIGRVKKFNWPLKIIANSEDVNVQSDYTCPKCDKHIDSRFDDNRWVHGNTISEWFSKPFSEWKALGISKCDSILRCSLSYIAPNRKLSTLSLGEARRFELIGWIHQAASGRTIIFDEPGIGLHGHERIAVAGLMQDLLVNGNTIMTAGATEEFLRAANECWSIGPGAGEEGGRIVYKGDYKGLSITFPELKKTNKKNNFLTFQGIKARYLDIDKIEIPLNQIVAVCGVSGSGKSTLFEKEILPRLQEMQGNNRKLARNSVHSLLRRSLLTNSRSTLATLCGVAPLLRTIFAKSTTAHVRGVVAGDFVPLPLKGGCNYCEGLGAKDLSACSYCEGLGLRADLLEIECRGLQVKEWLSLPISQLLPYAPKNSVLLKSIELLCRFGFSKRRFGEKGRLFSFGERSRLSLVKRLSVARKGSNKIFLLDEPCLGLSPKEVSMFLDMLNELCDEGHTFWMIEHHQHLLRQSDYLLEIGPGAGEKGGRLMFSGAPADLVAHKTLTSQWFLEDWEIKPVEVKPASSSVKFASYPDGIKRDGYERIRNEWMREQNTRSVLTNNLYRINSQEEASLAMPIVWPAAPSEKTKLGDVLGLKSWATRLITTSGDICCSNCGGVGPWSSLYAFMDSLEIVEELSFGCPFPEVLQDKKDAVDYLASAGYRELLNKSSIHLDTFSFSGLESRDRVIDLEIQLRNLKVEVLEIFNSQGSLLFAQNIRACRDCGVVCGMEKRVDGKTLDDIMAVNLVDFPKFCKPYDLDLSISIERLLVGNTLGKYQASDALESCTDLEARIARLGGWLLFPVHNVCFLFDNILAGLPVICAKNLSDWCLESGMIMHHADGEGHFSDDIKPVDINFSFFPKKYSTDQGKTLRNENINLGDFLEIWNDVASFFEKSQSARLRGLKAKDLHPQKSSFRCEYCSGKGWVVTSLSCSEVCSFCKGRCFTDDVLGVFEESITLSEIAITPISKLFEEIHFSALTSKLTALISAGLGGSTLSQHLSTLPEAVVAIARIQKNSFSPVVGALRGLNCLEVEPVALTIKGSESPDHAVEWFENHPQF